jgi:hypothetical protein
VWADSSGADSYGYGIRAQVFGNDGTRLGAEHIVNATGALAQWRPVVTALDNGNFAVAWEDQSASGGDTASNAIRAQVFQVGAAPAITSDGGGAAATISVAENTTAVTTVTAVDPDSATLFYQIAGGVDSGAFQINFRTGALSFVSARNFEVPGDDGGQNSYEVSVAVTDGALFDLQTITVNVTDVNEAPAITSNGGGDSATVSAAENTTVVTTVAATDPDAGATVQYAIAGGADASRFRIDATTGALSFVAAPDFESPADADHDNNYQIIVRANDGGLLDDQTITVAVSDVPEQPSPVATSGDELLVNTTTYGHQSRPAFAASANGQFVATWTDGSQTGGDTSSEAVRAQLFHADGSKSGSELLVNSETTAAQNDSAVTVLSDGRFVVAWTSYHDPSGLSLASDVRAQVFAADGTPAGSEFVISTASTRETQPVLGALAGGRFVAAWTGLDQNAEGIRAQIFNADGTASGDELQVNTTLQSSQLDPAVTVLANGDFVVAWTDSSGTGGDQSLQSVRAQIFHPDGARVGGEFLLNTTTIESQSVPALAALPDGRFAAAWVDNSATGGDTDHDAVRGQLFNADGTTSGAEFLVNTTTAFWQETPTVAGLNDGRFVVAWVDMGQNEDQSFRETIRAQVFNGDGTRFGTELALNTASDSLQFGPTVTALADGRFALGWEGASATGDTSGLGIHGQIFDARDAAIHLTGTAGDDEYVGTRFDDTLRGAGGNDHLDAGDGDDTAIFAQNRDQYTLQTLGGGKIIVSGPDGVDTLSHFEHLQFAGITLDVASSAPGLVWLIGTPDEDTFTALPGNERIDGLGSTDTVIFDFRLVDATVTFAGNRTIVDGPSSHTVLTGFETFAFADGTVNINDGDPLVDDLFYYARNHDVWNAHVDADTHYRASGWHEGRDPNALFDTAGYLAANPDVAAAGVNPLDHYHQTGWHEGRDPSAWFDTTLYLLRNPDVAAAGIDPLAHYLAAGRAEGRIADEAVGSSIVGGFDAEYYLFHNPDVAAAGIDPLFHYNLVGWREGRDPNGWFDTSDYLAHYADVAAAGINPLQHYELFGRAEGRDPSSHFNTASYLAENADVAAAGVNPLDHFLRFGIYEGRDPSPLMV